MKNLLMIGAVTATLAACGSMQMPGAMSTADADDAAVPAAVRVPTGQKKIMSTRGVGEIAYECREKKDAAGQFEWAFVGPLAVLYGADMRPVGKYYAGPVWESADGSKVSGKQLAIAASAPGNIPMQLVKAEPAMGAGAMQGVTYIQRLNTKGGVPPASACDASVKGAKQQVRYEADYVFFGG